ncbi:MAG: hypothetical protein M3O70_03890 [Actinomycetota bacterium]|nr:hypothetical protein [Actinomycetota bacterium]
MWDPQPLLEPAITRDLLDRPLSIGSATRRRTWVQRSQREPPSRFPTICGPSPRWPPYFRVCERTIREWRDLDATFPAPLDLPGRLVRWYRQDVIDWALSLRGGVV